MQTGYPAPPPLEYGQTPAPDARPADVVGPLVAWAGFAAAVTFAMLAVLKARQVFLDFHVRLPGVTQALLNLQGALSTWYGLTLLWLIPVGVAAVTWPARRRTKRLVGRLGVVMTMLFIAYVVVAIGIPLMTIAEGISQSPTGK